MNKKSARTSTKCSVWNSVYFSVYFSAHRCTLRCVEDIVHACVRYKIWHSSVHGLIDDGLNRPIQVHIESAVINCFKQNE
jgi:hypothetical protein